MYSEKLTNLNHILSVYLLNKFWCEDIFSGTILTCAVDIIQQSLPGFDYSKFMYREHSKVAGDYFFF